jgi:hypothetical protein
MQGGSQVFRSNYPNGFKGGLTVRGMPMVAGHAGRAIWVDSVNGTNGDGSYQQPYTSIANALVYCVADRGDIILCKSGHAEAISAAGGLTIGVAGVSIVGMGQGADRPKFTFGTAAAASILISAKNVSIENVIGLSGLDQLTKPFDVTGDDCYLDIEWQDTADNVEAVLAVRAVGVNRLTAKVKHLGRTGGSHATTIVQLNGVATADIALNAYGKYSTAAVNFVTAACTNVKVSGDVYNSGTVDGSKLVVDTIGGSTWFANLNDGGAGGVYQGGSGTALARIDTTVAVATVDGAANAQSKDVVGNKSDAAVAVIGTTKSLMAYLKGILDSEARVSLSATAVMVNGNTIFTVAGGPIMIESLISECVTGNDATASTVQYQNVPTVGTSTTISGASSSIANAAAGATVALVGTTLATAALYAANGPSLIASPGCVLAMPGTIKVVIGVGSTTGTWRHRIRFRPLAAGVTVT